MYRNDEQEYTSIKIVKFVAPGSEGFGARAGIMIRIVTMHYFLRNLL